MPLDQWLPARYLASFTWPVPSKLAERRDDGITYYNKSRRVDQPFIATVSADRKWVVASFTRTTGNVWSNPELTCQHVDPQTALGPGQHVAFAVKILVFKGLSTRLRKRPLRSAIPCRSDLARSLRHGCKLLNPKGENYSKKCLCLDRFVR